MLVADGRGVKAHGMEGKLHDRPHAEGVPPNSLNRYSSKSKKPRVCIISIACLR